MAESKFIIVNGLFHCKQCKDDVNTSRFWFETGDVTWMCAKKHISKVGLVPKKKKKSDFDNE